MPEHEVSKFNHDLTYFSICFSLGFLKGLWFTWDEDCERNSSETDVAEVRYNAAIPPLHRCTTWTWTRLRNASSTNAATSPESFSSCSQEKSVLLLYFLYVALFSQIYHLMLFSVSFSFFFNSSPGSPGGSRVLATSKPAGIFHPEEPELSRHTVALCPRGLETVHSRQWWTALGFGFSITQVALGMVL